MALYSLCKLTWVMEDNFAWYDAANDEYWFNGATLSKGGWVTNSISLDKYFAITNRQGIGIREDKIVLMEAGKEMHAVNVPDEIYSVSDINWRVIKVGLKTTWPREDAQAILSVMEAWENVSCSTLEWVSKALNSLGKPQDVVEIYVTGLQWLWHNCTSETVIIGYGQEIWGSTSLVSSEEKVITRGAMPIHNGWLVGVSNKEKYLLRRDRDSINSSHFIFPYGPWENPGCWEYPRLDPAVVWRYWYSDQSVLTPRKRLVAIPFLANVKRVNPNWMCFEAYRVPSHLLLIRDDGKSYNLDFAKRPSRADLSIGPPAVYPGERCVLFCYRANNNKWRYFALMDGDLQTNVGDFSKFRWVMKVAPPDVWVESYPFHLKIEGKEAFVFSFCRDKFIWFGIVDEQGRFGIVPWSFEYGVCVDKYVDANGVERNDRFVIGSPAEESGSHFPPVVVGISNGQGYMSVGSGVHISWPLFPFPKGKEGMWPYLASVLECSDASRKNEGEDDAL